MSGRRDRASGESAGILLVVAGPGMLAPTLPGAAFAGRAAKNSLASRAITARSGRDAIAACGLSPFNPLEFLVETDKGLSADAGSLVLMILVHNDVIENAKSIFGENGQRAIQRDQV